LRLQQAALRVNLSNTPKNERRQWILSNCWDDEGVYRFPSKNVRQELGNFIAIDILVIVTRI